MPWPPTILCCSGSAPDNLEPDQCNGWPKSCHARPDLENTCWPPRTVTCSLSITDVCGRRRAHVRPRSRVTDAPTTMMSADGGLAEQTLNPIYNEAGCSPSSLRLAAQFQVFCSNSCS